ncbi:N-acetylmuramoyl-L-alanine amidase [Longirhabdus pacifica]|uniref:N-acetylmuramoyl-L-alanine amidase n=1 Tax=Longirhabdus pacifica TaxID=2305227 RepID=UPI0013E8CBDB|nr:N-acetylmuramoyl-L-alanine amidase [Longirhabdus pacifica]
MSNRHTTLRLAIDAGHGPHTPGKRSPDGTLREFQFNSAVADDMKQLLLDHYDGVEILFTHDPNWDVPLQARTDQANAWQADVFLSVHANAFGYDWNEVSGIETYVFSQQNVKSVALANSVQETLIQQTGRKNRGVKAANFHVLRETVMPAILVECEFMTNIEALDLLESDGYRRQCAEAIVQAIAKTYNLTEKQAPPDIPNGWFKDVSADRWSYNAIRNLHARNLISGFPDGTFRPEQMLTREEAATLIWKVINYRNGGDGHAI